MSRFGIHVVRKNNVVFRSAKSGRFDDTARDFDGAKYDFTKTHNLGAKDVIGSGMTDITKWTLLIQVASTFSMVGLIWFVQIVHYPLFSEVGRENFVRYESEHQRLTTLVVVPLMLSELATAVLLLGCRPPGVSVVTVSLGLGLLISIWLVTFLVQVPQHGSLTLGYDATVQSKLVFGNWYRTIAWSARGVLVIWIVSQTLTALTVEANQSTSL